VASAQLELQLPTSEQAPEIARRRVVERFAAQLDPVQLEDARLLTSELVTNAVVHGKGAIGLSALLDDDRLMIEVTDEGDGFERTVRQHGLDAVGGNGPNIVDRLASRWGIHAGSNHVCSSSNGPGHGSGPTPSPRASAAGGGRSRRDLVASPAISADAEHQRPSPSPM
jgi:anti-sigma regulatory factor (Ser/Thr protein kinase)